MCTKMHNTYFSSTLQKWIFWLSRACVRCCANGCYEMNMNHVYLSGILTLGQRRLLLSRRSNHGKWYHTQKKTLDKYFLLKNKSNTHLLPFLCPVVTWRQNQVRQPLKKKNDSSSSSCLICAEFPASIKLLFSPNKGEASPGAVSMLPACRMPALSPQLWRTSSESFV